MPITLLNDVLFKVVFGSQRHSEALRGLLNAILDLTGDRRIAEITILNPLREKERLEDKATILDVKARDGQGALYNIEVQLQSQVGYKERSLFYAANMVCQQIQVGEEYRDLRKTIHISLTDFVLFPDQDDLHSTYLLYDKKHDRTLGDLFELHYLEMCKFRKLDVTELLSSLERWLFFFRQATNYTGVDNLPESLQLEEGMSTAMEATHQALSDEEVRYAIEARQKWERDRITQLNAAVEEGEARGEARGLALGEARGEARGLALAKAELARSLLASGQSEEFVFEHTGLRRTDL